ncbi:GMC family oxidoreductase N-terminal domain-containing protein [Pseudomonas lini]
MKMFCPTSKKWRISSGAATDTGERMVRYGSAIRSSRKKSSYDFIEAANRIGIPVTEDMNGAVHDGVGFMQHNIQDGQRMSTYRAFIEPVIERPNLTVRTGCELQRVLFDGRTAVGVEVLKGGRLERIYAAREVILSAGSLKTPQMLMLSGVGPRAELEKARDTCGPGFPGGGAEPAGSLLYSHRLALHPRQFVQRQSRRPAKVLGRLSLPDDPQRLSCPRLFPGRGVC